MEVRDLVWIELILVEYAGSTVQVALETARHKPPSFSREKIAQFNRARALKLDLAAVSKDVSILLRNLELCAQRRGFSREKFEEIVANRHKRYGPDHPWTWIRPYLDPAKLHVYLDCYPGLCEMTVGLYL